MRQTFQSTPAIQNKASTPTTSIFARHFEKYFSFLRGALAALVQNFIFRQTELARHIFVIISFTELQSSRIVYLVILI